MNFTDFILTVEEIKSKNSGSCWKVPHRNW